MAGHGARSEPDLRLAELVATVSLATDLAHDVPAESALKDAVLAVELARLMGWEAGDVSDAYYLALLYHIGCTGAVASQSRLGDGDDASVRRWMSEADHANRPEMMRIAVTRLVPRWGASGWAQADLAASGLSNRQVAQRLYVSMRTVATHLTHIYQKLGVDRREELNSALRRAPG